MYLILENHNYIYQVQSTAQIFFQNETFLNTTQVQEIGYTLKSTLLDDFVVSKFYENNVLVADKSVSLEQNNTDISHFVKISVFLLLSNYFNKKPSWGMITGIRPTKLVHSLINSGYDEEEIKNILKNKYFISDDKIDFCMNVTKNEINVLKQIDVNKNALYIGIPFCPSICAYCSFTSFSMKKYRDNGVMNDYVDTLINEIKYVIEHSKNKIENIYIGGGTPTSLDNENFEKLLKAITESIDLNEIKEFTVEAGRVDTINLENLLIMKKYNVSRISINAQSTNNNTLKINGRLHAFEDFKEKYLLAQKVGFDNINVDLIAGLLGENENDFLKSVDDIILLKPKNITIHTLAIKKGSIYKQNLADYDFINDENLKNSLDLAYRKLYKNEYIPYYMYRQKNMLGNFENTGFALKGYESIYNVSIILEVQSIIGTGAGSASKLVLNDNKITRSYNHKGVEEYIKMYDEIIKRKEIFT